MKIKVKGKPKSPFISPLDFEKGKIYIDDSGYIAIRTWGMDKAFTDVEVMWITPEGALLGLDNFTKNPERIDGDETFQEMPKGSKIIIKA